MRANKGEIKKRGIDMRGALKKHFWYVWNDIAGKTTEYSAEPVRWLKSGALLLAVHDEWTRNGGDFSEGSETVTIALDAEHKVSIQLGISTGMLETN